ncbi:Major intrinsic protein, partial [Dillenia turbinata]
MSDIMKDREVADLADLAIGNRLEPSPIYRNAASTSGQSTTYDQEMGPKNEVASEKSAFQSYLWWINPTLCRIVLAEVLGTFILMFCICGIIASTQATRGEIGLTGYATIAGLAIIVVIFSIGRISGAHVNPAATIAFATSGHFPWSKVPIYILAQVVGSTLATIVGRCVYGVNPSLMTTRALQGCSAAFWVELIATFIIMFLAAALTGQAKSVGPLSGIVVGIAIALSVLITGPISGGSMNPARSLGPALVAWRFDDLWIYMVGPTIGANFTYKSPDLQFKFHYSHQSIKPFALI